MVSEISCIEQHREFRMSAMAWSLQIFIHVQAYQLPPKHYERSAKPSQDMH